MVMFTGMVEVSRSPISLSSAVSDPYDKLREPHTALPKSGTVLACKNKYDMK